MHMPETRDLLAKQRSALEGKINNLMAMQEIEMKQESLSSKIALERVLASAVSPMAGPELRVLVRQIRSLSESIAELDEQLKEEGQHLPGHENLTRIEGIGTLTATILLTAIGPISDFADENKLAAYLELMPKVENSNEAERSGRINKQGNKVARTAVVQCGLVAKRSSPYLNRFYERIKQRRGGGKAKIALARKLVKIVYDTLKNRWVPQDFPHLYPGRLKPGYNRF